VVAKHLKGVTAPAEIPFYIDSTAVSECTVLLYTASVGLVNSGNGLITQLLMPPAAPKSLFALRME
jgi:hypothetical protein